MVLSARGLTSVVKVVVEDCGRWLNMKLFDPEIESWMVTSLITLSFVGMCCV